MGRPAFASRRRADLAAAGAARGGARSARARSDRVGSGRIGRSMAPMRALPLLLTAARCQVIATRCTLAARALDARRPRVAGQR